MWQVVSILFIIRSLGIQALPSMRNQALLERTYRSEEMRPRVLRSETLEVERAGHAINLRKQSPSAEKVSLLEQAPNPDEPAPTWSIGFCDANGNPPAGGLPEGQTSCVDHAPSAPIQDEANTVALADWPADFCVNVQVTAPNADDYTDSPLKAIALLGGNWSTPTGDDAGKCGFFLIAFAPGNNPVMGVQCDGGGSDKPLGAGVNLTTGTFHRIKFCYQTGNQVASIIIDGQLTAQATKNFVFPRQGQVSLLTGSHAVAEYMENEDGAQFNEFSISLQPGTTTTTFTTTTTVGTTENTWNNFQEHPFAVQLMPRTVPAQRTATITDLQWPPDFCINVVISTPNRGGGMRAIALVGGAQACGSFVIFYDDQCRVGMGVQCNLAGSDDQLVSAASIAEGTHALSFCYAKFEHKAAIYVDSRLITSDARTWNFQNHGNVSIFAGSHVNASEILQGVTMQSLSIVSRNPEADSPLPTDAMGNTDGVTVTLPPYINDIVTNGGGSVNLSHNFSWDSPAGSVTGANGSYGYRSDGSWGPLGPSPNTGTWVQNPDGSWKQLVEGEKAHANGTIEVKKSGPTTTVTTTTFTTTTVTTTTTTVIIQHSEYNANHTQNHENTNVHKRSETNTVTNDGASSHYSSHVEGR